jgi:hypothetical protein
VPPGPNPSGSSAGTAPTAATRISDPRGGFAGSAAASRTGMYRPTR